MEINLLLHILTILSPEKTFTINMTTAPSIFGHMMSGTDVTRPCELQLQCTVLIVINYSEIPIPLSSSLNYHSFRIRTQLYHTIYGETESLSTRWQKAEQVGVA